MGNHVIRMPDIGEGIAEVELVEWFVKVGDIVSEDQVLADVMTDKATVEIPSSVAGTVLALGGEPGEVMAVGAELIRIQVEDVQHEAQPQPRPEAPVEVEVVEQAVAEIESPAEPPASLAPAPGPSSEPDTPHHESRALAAPAVRKRASEAGVDLMDVHGSGPQGRVLHSDLDALLMNQAGLARPTDDNPQQRIPVIGLRRKIAQRMQQSTQQVAHFSYVEEVDVTALEALRIHLNQQWGESRGKLTLLPFLVRAIVVAAREYPQINAHYDDQQQVLTRHGAVHVGVATQSDNGLMVPVLRDAQTQDLWQTAAQITRLAVATRSGKATREQLSGSTITLSSLGALGGIVSTPVINQPEVAIVGVNRIVERAVVVDGQIVVRKMMNLSSSFDHRVVDGMDAARFIQAMRRLLEQPATLFL